MASIDLETALLQALASGPSYGLELITRVRTNPDADVAINEGNVYPALRAMEREGLLESYEGDPLPERGGRPRRYYKLTDEGLKRGASAAFYKGTGLE